MPTTKTTRVSWFSKLGNSFGNILTGCVLLVIAIWLLFWNEGRAVQRSKALQEGAGLVQTIDPTDPATEAHDQLVYFTGQVDFETPAADPDFPLAIEPLLLERQVEMYQWIEESQSESTDKLGGATETTTTYSYRRDWSPTVRDSSAFQEPEAHQNPSELPYQNKTFVASDVTVGQIQLPESLVDSLNPGQDLSLNNQVANEATISAVVPYPVRVTGSALFLGEEPSKPQIGDMRISFRYLEPTEVSVVGQLNDQTIQPYTTKNGNQIQFIQTGQVAPEAMFAGAQTANRTTTWMLRALGGLFMLMAFRMILSLLEAIADVIPLLGDIVKFGTNLASIVLTIILAAIIIALAWMAARPIVSVLMLLFAAGVGVAVFRMKKVG